MRRPVLLSGVAVCVACGGNGSTPETSVVRDSAGITIVENQAAAWVPGEEWRLSVEPTVVIGVADGPEEYQLFQANQALRLATGEILVVNGGTSQLRFYDSAGVFLRSVGREGEGPGEYAMIGGVARSGEDSLIVSDFGNDRLAMLDVRGQFGRTFKMQPAPGAGHGFLVGPFDDRSLLAQANPVTAYDPPQGGSRGSVVYSRYDPAGEVVDTLRTRPGSEMYGGELDGRPMVSGMPFGRRGIVAVGGDRWIYGSSDAWEIEVYSMQGDLLRLIRLATPNRAITDEIAEAYRTRLLEGSSRIPESLRRWRANMPLPETMPAYMSFLVDDLGNLWVREYTQSTEPQSWVVFDTVGRFLGHVDLPTESGWPTHIGADFVLGTWNDEMDVEHVKLYELIKPKER
jgi:hypothetical protein